MKKRHTDAGKRVADVVVSGALLTVTAPLQIGVAIAVRIGLGTPVLFRQARPGRNGELFTLIKFRTMQPVDPGRGLVDDDERLTSLGQMLRRTSLDELPTLWNVLRGHMGLVGPRPLLPEYLTRYSPEQARRHEVRPGVTGLAQISGRNQISWERRLALDVEYVDRRSLGLDVRILWATVRTVFSGRGVAADGHVTMPRFDAAEGDPAVSGHDQAETR